MSDTLVDQDLLNECRKIIDLANAKNVSLYLPIDYQVAIDSIQGTLKYVGANAFKQNYIGCSIGPQTIEKFSSIIGLSSTIFFNAAMGFQNRKETLYGTHELLKAIASSDAFNNCRWGVQSQPTSKLHNDASFDYLSTGGGATLTYLSGRELPGLELLHS